MHKKCFISFIVRCFLNFNLDLSSLNLILSFKFSSRWFLHFRDIKFWLRHLEMLGRYIRWCKTTKKQNKSKVIFSWNSRTMECVTLYLQLIRRVLAYKCFHYLTDFRNILSLSVFLIFENNSLCFILIYKLVNLHHYCWIGGKTRRLQLATFLCFFSSPDISGSMGQSK